MPRQDVLSPGPRAFRGSAPVLRVVRAAEVLAVVRALVRRRVGTAGVLARGRRWRATAELVDEIREREEICSTALIPGVALPHPRHPVEYDIVDSFVVVGLTHSGIAFGAPDGSLTRLFFLVCCKDDRTHLHVLARLGQMLHDPEVIGELTATEDPDLLREALARHEQAALTRAE